MASPLLYAAFFVSGFTALLYEIVWQRLLVRITGATMPATVAIYSLFMLGLALGSFFSVRYCEKSTRPLKSYALAELLVAALGLFVLYLCDQNTIEVCSAYLAKSALCFSVRANLVAVFSTVAAIAITLATASMSVAFNCGLQALLTSEIDGPKPDVKSTSAGSLAYVLNLAGAALGSVSSAFLCLPVWGLTSTALGAVALNVVFSVLLWSGPSQSKLTEKIATANVEPRNQKYASALLLIFVFSLVGMSLEITWTRLLCLVCGSSTYAIGSVLAAVLVSLLAAASVARVWNHKNSLPFLLLAGISGSAAIILSINLLLMPYLTWSILWLQNALSNLGCSVDLQFFLPRIAIAFGLICGSTFVIGMVTPLLIEFLNEIENTVATTAYALTASTSGSILGALITAFVTIPNERVVSGIEAALISCVCVLAFVGALCLRFSRASFSKIKLHPSAWLIVVSLLLMALHPQWPVRLMSLGPSFVTVPNHPFLSFKQFEDRINNGGEKSLFYQEGSSATVTVETNEKTNVIYLKSNGKVESSLPVDWHKPAPTSDYRTQLFLGVVPVLYFGPDAKELSALTIGFGSGITSGLLLSFEQIFNLTTCEIEPAIYKAEPFFERSNFQPLRKEWLKNMRIKPKCADARAFLNQNNALFNIIVSQPSEPWISGSSDLFTLEFFRLAQTRLKQNGVFVQWLQLYCIDERLLANLIATFEQVFPNTYILHPRDSGDIVLIGVMNDKLPKDFFEKIVSQDLSSWHMAQTVLETLNATTTASSPVLNCDFILPPDDVVAYLRAHRNIALNTDGHIATEYQLPQELLLSEENISQNILKLKTVRARQ